MKKYKAETFCSVQIIEVIIERETDHYVFIKSKWRKKLDRELKQCSYHKYFNTFKEAKDYLIDRQIIKIASKKQQLEIAEGRLKEIKEL